MDENARFLQAVSLFSELPEPVVRTLAGKMQELHFEKGRRICEENREGNALFIIKAGIVQIHVGEGAEKKTLAYLKRGDYFGEMAVFTGDPRSASATAIAEVTLLGLTKADFETEVRANPSIALELLKTLSRRLARANQRSGSAESKAGKILFLSGSEKGAGKTAVARDLAHSLAKLSGKRVVLFDPNVQNPSVAHSVGVREDCDLAKELVSTEHLTVERYVKKTPWGFSVLLPQRVERTTYPLRESHHHVLVNALAEKFDYLVVDSSSTMAKLNKHLMESAARIVVVLSGRQQSLVNFLEPFERMILGPGAVERRKVVYLLNQNGGVVEDPVRLLGGHAKDIALTLPHDPEALKAADDRGMPGAEAAPESGWAKAAHETGREVFLDHSLELLLPELEGRASRLEALVPRLAGDLERIFSTPPERGAVDLEDADRDSLHAARAQRLGVRVTESVMTEGMDGFLTAAESAREFLGEGQILIRIDGRPSLV